MLVLALCLEFGDGKHADLTVHGDESEFPVIAETARPRSWLDKYRVTRIFAFRTKFGIQRTHPKL